MDSPQAWKEGFSGCFGGTQVESLRSTGLSCASAGPHARASNAAMPMNQPLLMPSSRDSPLRDELFDRQTMVWAVGGGRNNEGASAAPASDPQVRTASVSTASMSKAAAISAAV